MLWYPPRINYPIATTSMFQEQLKVHLRLPTNTKMVGTLNPAMKVYVDHMPLMQQQY